MEINALVNANQYQNALDLLEAELASAQESSAVMKVCYLKRAYIYYKTDRFEEAFQTLSVLKSLAKDHRTQIQALLLEAQIKYRMEAFSEAADIYTHLLENFMTSVK